MPGCSGSEPGTEVLLEVNRDRRAGDRVMTKIFGERMSDAMEEVDTPEKHIERIDGWIRALTSEAHFQDERVCRLPAIQCQIKLEV
ncbi:hypothetical protein ASJ34_21580, partial [Xanthomonas campestris pv. campestris]